MLTGLIVLCAAAGVASGASPATSSLVLAEGSGLRGFESMRVSEVGQALSNWRLWLLIGGSIVMIALFWGGDAIRPGSLARAGLRDVKPLPTPVWLMAACITLLAPSLVAGPVSQFDALTGGSTETLRGIAATQGVAYLTGIAVAVGLMVMASKAAPQAGLKVVWIDGPLGFGLLLLVIPLILLVGDLCALIHSGISGGDHVERLAHPTLRILTDNAGDPWTWVLIACAVIGAPVVEEIVYRGFVQSGLLRLTGHAWISAIVTAAIFGTVHAIGPAESSSPWYAAVTVGVMGLACGAAFERTKRIGVPIAMHAAFNAGNLVLALWVFDAAGA